MSDEEPTRPDVHIEGSLLSEPELALMVQARMEQKKHEAHMLQEHYLLRRRLRDLRRALRRAKPCPVCGRRLM